MPRTPGVLFSVESPNIRSRQAQVARLARVMRVYLAQTSREVHVVHLPRHGNPCAWLVERYESGVDGPMEHVDPRQAALYYTIERLNAGIEIQRLLEAGHCVVASGYTASTLVQEGSKLRDPDRRFQFYRWLWDTEFRTYGVPLPEYQFIVLPNRYSGLWELPHFLYDELPMMFVGDCERVQTSIGRRDYMRGAHARIWRDCKIILDIRLKSSS